MIYCIIPLKQHLLIIKHVGFSSDLQNNTTLMSHLGWWGGGGVHPSVTKTLPLINYMQ